MDNSPMNPYLTPASRTRTDALAYENAADRALFGAEWALDCGNRDEAVRAYRSAARSWARAADYRAEAAAMPGGTEFDRQSVAWNRNHAERCNATADRLLYGDAAGADGGAQ